MQWNDDRAEGCRVVLLAVLLGAGVAMWVLEENVMGSDDQQLHRVHMQHTPREGVWVPAAGNRYRVGGCFGVDAKVLVECDLGLWIGQLFGHGTVQGAAVADRSRWALIWSGDGQSFRSDSARWQRSLATRLRSCSESPDSVAFLRAVLFPGRNKPYSHPQQ